MHNRIIAIILILIITQLAPSIALAQGLVETKINSELAIIRMSESIANKSKLLVIVESFQIPNNFINSIEPYIKNINSTLDPAVHLIVSENFLKAKVVEVIAKADNFTAPPVGSEIIFSMALPNVYMFHEEIPRKNGKVDPDGEDPAENNLTVETFLPYMENPDLITTLEGMPGKWLLALTPITKTSYSTSAQGIFAEINKINAYSFLFQKGLALPGKIYALERFSDATPVLNSPPTANAKLVSSQKASLASIKSKNLKVPSNFILKSEVTDIKKITSVIRNGKKSKVIPKTQLGKRTFSKLQ